MDEQTRRDIAEANQLMRAMVPRTLKTSQLIRGFLLLTGMGTPPEIRRLAFTPEWESKAAEMGEEIDRRFPIPPGVGSSSGT
jgi:hypothetical protein